ncbi:MAG: FAD:protein FMN transferase [Acidimicrobiales bacterium]|jgi:thiamine biosynthesis lipoprotein
MRYLENVMGTVVTIDVYTDGGGADPELSIALARARAVLHRADAVFSTWKPDSPMSRLRRGEITVDEAPAEVADVLSRCAEARDCSRGLFDPWAMPGGVDPTGYVKGWAADRALDVLRASGISGALVNAAGDIAGFTGPSIAEPFRIGIAHPLERGRLFCVIELSAAVATSGTYERGAHLIDPRSGRSGTRVASATVSGPDLGLADALATALVVAGVDGLPVLDPLAGYEALVIAFDGTAEWTSGFPFAS